MSISKYAQKSVEDISNFFIKGLQEETAPWTLPWSLSHDDIRPFNAASMRQYNGINELLLMHKARKAGYTDNRWMTYNQFDKQGFQDNTGEQSVPVMFWTLNGRVRDKEADGTPKVGDDGKAVYKQIRLNNPILKIYRVFNVAQFVGYNVSHPNPKLGLDFDLSNPAHQNYVDHFKQAGDRVQGFVDKLPIEIKEGAASLGRASYGSNAISMPPMSSFDDPLRYYTTLLHETCHWAADKLDISSNEPFGSVGYAKEELRVEIASYLLGLDFKVGHDPSDHRKYVKSWIRALEDDPHEILRASADASKIVTLLNELELELGLENPNIDQIIHSHGGYMSIDDPLTAITLNEVLEKKYDELLQSNEEALEQGNRRFYLAVDYARKELFKEEVAAHSLDRNLVGYDKKNKCWWINKGSLDGLPGAFKDFLPEELNIIDNKIDQYSSLEDFVLGTLREYDIQPHSGRAVDTSGNWVSAGTSDKPNGTHARYKVIEPRSADGNHGVMMKIWGRMEDTKTVFWKPEFAKAHHVTDEQKVAYHAWKLNASAALNDKQSVKAKTTEQINDYARRLIDDFYQHKARPINGQVVPYLVSKGIDSTEASLDDIRVDDDGKLVVPVKDWDGDITALQFIDEQGKYFNKFGQVDGAFYVVNEGGLDADTVYITEGLATGVSVKQALADDNNSLVVCALNISNISTVEEQFREAGFNTIVMGDNDYQHIAAGMDSNRYDGHRLEVARDNLEKTLSAGDVSIVPRFNDDDLNGGENKLTDWNDFSAKYGPDQIRQVVDRLLTQQSTMGYSGTDKTPYVRFNRPHDNNVVQAVANQRQNMLDKAIEN